MEWLIVLAFPAFGFVWGLFCNWAMNHLFLIDGD